MLKTFQARYVEHHAEVAKGFMKWYKNGTHVDVTIYAGGHRIEAHKLILAANSAFFNGLFLDKNKEHSHLNFTDVPYQSMKSLIEYMYSGDLVVERDFLPDCLQLGDSLRVKGISAVNAEDYIMEPAPVSEAMLITISRLMQNDSLQSSPGQEELLKKPQPRKKKKKHKHKSREIVECKTMNEDKIVQDETPKLMAKRIRSNNEYQLQQVQNKESDENIVVSTQEDIPSVEVENPTNISNDIINDISSPAFLQNNECSAPDSANTNETNCSTAELQEIYNFEEKEIKLELIEEFMDIKNIPTASDLISDKEVIEKIDENQSDSKLSEPSNADFKIDDLKNDVIDMGSDNTNTPSLDEQVSNNLQNIQNNELSRVYKLENTQEDIKKLRDSAPKKKGCKQRSRKRASRPPRNLDRELEKLFGDGFFGIGNKDKNNEYSSNIIERPKELSNLGAAIPQLDNLKAESEVKPSNKNPICPPPENILKNGKPSFSCALCKRVYTHKSNYRRHYTVFHKRCAEAVFECPMCKKKFTRSDNRTHHIRRIHGYTCTASLLSEKEALYYCPICKKGFTRIYNRKLHLLAEHDIKGSL